MTTSAERLSTPQALARLLPFAKPVLPRLLLGGATALVGGFVAIAIPLVLEALLSGPIGCGDLTATAWGSVAVLGLGLLEAIMVWARRGRAPDPVS